MILLILSCFLILLLLALLCAPISYYVTPLWAFGTFVMAVVILDIVTLSVWLCNKKEKKVIHDTTG